MKSGIIEEGSAADGDGHGSYAARRRNLACRSPALGRLMAHTKACRSTAPDQPAILARLSHPQRQPFIAPNAEHSARLYDRARCQTDYQRES